MPVKKSKRQLNNERLEKQLKESEKIKTAKILNQDSGFLLPRQAKTIRGSRELSEVYSLSYARKNTTPSKPDGSLDLKRTPKYQGELAAREALAQKEIDKKKKCTGVLYNKGAYQYITEGMDPTTLGKK
jgi:hypothetical protein